MKTSRNISKIMRAGWLLLFAAGVAQAADPVAFDMSLKDAKSHGGGKGSSIRSIYGDKLGPFVQVGGITLKADALEELRLTNSRVGGLGAENALFQIEFFLDDRGKSMAIVHQLPVEEEAGKASAVEKENEAAEELPYEHQALSEAADFAVAAGNVALLEALMKAGLKPNLPLGKDPGWSLLYSAAVYNQVDVAKFLRTNGADLGARSKYGDRAVDAAFEKGQWDFCEAVALPAAAEKMIDGIPESLLDEILQGAGSDRVSFLSLNGQDPAERLLDKFRDSWPNVVPRSRAEEVERAGNPTCYRDRKTKEFGWVVEIGLKAGEAGTYEWSIREASGPSLAGGGQGGKISRKYGYWIKHDGVSWAE